MQLMTIRPFITLVCAALIWAAIPAHSQQSDLIEPQSLDMQTTITSVTVYRGRASVRRSGSLELTPGLYEVRIADLPEAIDPQTIQARAQGAVSVLSVDFAQQQSSSPPQQFVELDAQIEQLQQQLREIAGNLQLIKSQEQFLDALATKTAEHAAKDGGTAELDIDAMRRQLAFVAEERSKLLASRTELDARQRHLEKELKAAQANRDALAGTSSTQRIATITLTATQAGPATIEMSYLVSQATWEPVYNIRASLEGSTASIEYEAVLTQRTGEDWNNVQMALSTAQPTVAANPPELRPWFVDLQRPIDAASGRGAPASSLSVAAPAERATAAGLEDFSKDANVAGSGSAVSFVMPRPVTVRSDAQSRQRTRIATITANPRFVHVATPLLTEAVYIRGDLVNASAYQLLPGKASIFVGQDYVGPTQLDAVAPNGEFRLHFGIDPAVKATRLLVTKRTENTGLLSGGRRTSYDYRIAIENGTAKPITLELWDRYPVSRTEDAQIDLVDLSHPLSNDPTYLAEGRPLGLLKWILTVPPTASGRGPEAVTYGVRVNRAKDVNLTPLPE